MWIIQSLEAYDRQFKWYRKKRPKELSAVLDNLETFFDGLQAGATVQNLMAAHRFLGSGQAGVIEIKQKGGPKNLAET